MKLVLWRLVAIGLAPCILIAWQFVPYRQASAIRQQLSYAPAGAIPHDEYVQLHLGAWNLEIYPRPWAFELLAAGVVAIVVSLAVLLHSKFECSVSWRLATMSWPGCGGGVIDEPGPVSRSTSASNSHSDANLAGSAANPAEPLRRREGRQPQTFTGPKGRTSMRTAVALVVVLMLAAGRGAGQDRKEPPARADLTAPWSEPVEGLQCWLQADRDDWKVGEVPSFRLHVRNQAKRDLEIHMAQDACKLEFDGAWFKWAAPVSILGGTWPAGRHYDDFEVRVTLEARWASGTKPIDLKPGKHKVRVAYVSLDRKQPVRVVSNAVEIQVTSGERKPSKDADLAIRELKEEVRILRQRLDRIEKLLSEIEKAK